MGSVRGASPARLRRLHEELLETGVDLGIGEDLVQALLTEIDYALRPDVHERRVPSVGAIVQPLADHEAWERGTRLHISRRELGAMPLEKARKFADGLSSWLIRRVDGDDEWAVFDRPSGSERDLVVMADAFRGTVVQRHPTGYVRVIDGFGVLRWDGVGWRHEPPVANWIRSITSSAFAGDADVLEQLLSFAIHDLGSRGIGATLVYRPCNVPGPLTEDPYPTPPPLSILEPWDLAPLRHVLAQIDGATFFDSDGTLDRLGSRLLPTAAARDAVRAFRGTRHTSGRRYSFDDRVATVIVVSEDGPVSVLRGGELIGTTSSVAFDAREAALAE